MDPDDIQNDPHFTRDRIDPLTGEHFIAEKSRKRKHKNDKNKNEFHNWKRRVSKAEAEMEEIFKRKLAKPVNNSEKQVIVESHPIEISKPVSPIVIAKVLPVPVPATVVPPIISPNKEVQFIMNFLGKGLEGNCNIDAMLHAGFDFDAIDSYETLPGTKKRMLNFGKYSIIWVTSQDVHITYRNCHLWKPFELVQLNNF